MSYLNPCKTADQLRHWLAEYLDLHLPDRAVCDTHQSPMQYIVSAYFEPARDQVVWAPRGGGKTTLAAAATLLELLHKPGISIRILGGSLEQSLRMWETLIGWLHEKFPEMLEKPNATARKVRLTNGSSAAILTQSQKSVRGLRVQKLRCDEVELFDSSIWSAAQMITRSKEIDVENGSEKQSIRGSIEALSTMHEVGGLMQEIIDHGQSTGKQIVRWCLLDVLEKCPDRRSCESCSLFPECKGIAKSACNGFFKIDDAISIKSRVSQEAWDTEMLCKRPSRKGSVFPMLDEQLHLRDQCPFNYYNNSEWWLAMDFGFSAPLVCLWVVRHGEMIYVADEHVQRGLTIDQHLEIISSRDWPGTNRIACDPAGAGPNEQTARSNIDLLKDRGYVVKSRGSRIVDGVEQIRANLRSATGDVRLMIHPRCRNLWSALRNYRYASNASELPLKDGTNDHCIDALRYFFANCTQFKTTGRVY